jgi:Lon protease-like protein
MEIPLFPLHVVLVPGAPLPLHVFEPRYRALLADCLAGRSPFGVVCLSAGREAGGERVSFAAVGTLAEIREVVRYPDGRADLVAIGTRRFRLSGVVTDRTPYLVGIGEVLDEPLGDAERVARLAASVRGRFVDYLRLLQHDEDDSTSLAERIAPRDDPGRLGHAVAGLLQVELQRRQRLLEAETTEERLADLDALLAREIALLGRRLGPFDPDVRLLPLRRN